MRDEHQKLTSGLQLPLPPGQPMEPWKCRPQARSWLKEDVPCEFSYGVWPRKTEASVRGPKAILLLSLKQPSEDRRVPAYFTVRSMNRTELAHRPFNKRAQPKFLSARKNFGPNKRGTSLLCGHRRTSCRGGLFYIFTIRKPRLARLFTNISTTA